MSCGGGRRGGTGGASRRVVTMRDSSPNGTTVTAHRTGPRRHERCVLRGPCRQVVMAGLLSIAILFGTTVGLSVLASHRQAWSGIEFAEVAAWGEKPERLAFIASGQAIGASYHQVDIYPDQSSVAASGLPDEQAARLLQRLNLHDVDHGVYAAFEVGFPVRAFRCTRDAGRDLVWSGGLPISDFYAIPFAPDARGCVINVSCYMTVILGASIAVRRCRTAFRKSRNRCWRCTYPRGASPQCTECGADLV